MAREKNKEKINSPQNIMVASLSLSLERATIINGLMEMVDAVAVDVSNRTNVFNYCYAGCITVGGVTGLEIQMTSSNPLSLLYRTDSSGSPYWKGVSILYNLNTGSHKDFLYIVLLSLQYISLVVSS